MAKQTKPTKTKTAKKTVKKQDTVKVYVQHASQQDIDHLNARFDNQFSTLSVQADAISSLRNEVKFYTQALEEAIQRITALETKKKRFKLF